MDPAHPKFQEEASQIYQLLKAYQIQPPQTVQEFVNLAHADLRAFWFGGGQGTTFTFGSFMGINIGLLFALLAFETLLYQVLMLFVTKRLYRAAWLEIDTKR